MDLGGVVRVDDEDPAPRRIVTEIERVLLTQEIEVLL